MAIKPMPTPSADPYYTINNKSTDKNKKKNQTATSGVTNTVTPPQKPAPKVPSIPPVTQNYAQPVPKPNAATQTNNYLSNASNYNPLCVKQNSTGSQSAMDTIYNKTVTYDAVPIPQKKSTEAANHPYRKATAIPKQSQRQIQAQLSKQIPYPA